MDIINRVAVEGIEDLRNKHQVKNAEKFKKEKSGTIKIIRVEPKEKKNVTRADTRTQTK